MPPPPLIALVVAGASAYMSYRWLSTKGAKLVRNLKKAGEEMKRSADERAAGGKPGLKDLGTLKRDPLTGDYKPDRTSGDNS